MASIGDIAEALRVDADEIAFLSSATPAQRSALLEAFHDAADVRERELREAADRALGFIPRPPRGRVMKLLRGGRG